MGDNVRITVSRRRFGNLSDGRKGEKNAKYVPPTAVVTVFALMTLSGCSAMNVLS